MKQKKNVGLLWKCGLCGLHKDKFKRVQPPGRKAKRVRDSATIYLLRFERVFCKCFNSLKSLPFILNFKFHFHLFSLWRGGGETEVLMFQGNELFFHTYSQTTQTSTPTFACKLSHHYPSWIVHYLKSLKEMIVRLNIFQGMINFGQSLVLRRQTQRLGGWTELDLAIKESTALLMWPLGFYQCGLRQG